MQSDGRSVVQIWAQPHTAAVQTVAGNDHASPLSLPDKLDLEMTNENAQLLNSNVADDPNTVSWEVVLGNHNH